MTVVEQQGPRPGRDPHRGGFQPLRHGRAQLALAAGMFGDLFEIGGDGACVDKLPAAFGGSGQAGPGLGIEGDGGHGPNGIAEVGREVTAPGGIFL